MTIADTFILPGLLDGLLPNLYLSLFVQVLVIVLIPIVIASTLLDRRVTEPTTAPLESRPTPEGVRSATGQTIRKTRQQPRLRRVKQAAKLETIVVKPSVVQNASAQGETKGLTTSTDGTQSSSSQFIRARGKRSKDEQARDLQVEEQLAAIEQEMAKLEGELEETGIPISSPASSIESNEEESTTSTVGRGSSPENSAPLPTGEDATSELQAVEEILTRLEQKRQNGEVDDPTYEKLREKYLKRKDDLANSD
jgi:hypothetical protein